MTKVYLCRAILDHVPDLEELRANCDPDKDQLVSTFDEDVDLSLYLRYTGLRIYYNGRSKYLIEMKYTIEDGERVYPDYELPDRSQYIII